MNVLFITSAKGWGGGEVWLSQISGGLRSRGHRVMIVCRPDAEFLKRVTDPVEIYPITLSGDFQPVAVYRILKLIRRESVDIVCVNMERELRLGCIAGALAGIPVIHSREVDRPIKDTLVNRIFFKYLASAIIVNSHATKNTLLESAPWLASQEMPVIWKGVDLDKFTPPGGGTSSDSLTRQGGECVAGFVGRLDEQKGIATLLDAFRTVAGRGARIRLLVIGEGNLRPMIEQFIVTHSLENSIDLLGYQEDIPAVMRRIDFLVMPSVWEGFGYSAVEAMAAGKAVIATRVSSLPEIVTDGVDGILVPPKSPELLAEAILALGADPQLRKRLGEHARTTAVRKFSFTTMLDATEKLFLSHLPPGKAKS